MLHPAVCVHAFLILYNFVFPVILPALGSCRGHLGEGDARMRSILFEIPGWELKIHSYGVMILIACFAALAIAVWRARRDQIDPNSVYELAAWLFLGGAVGARAST